MSDVHARGLELREELLPHLPVPRHDLLRQGLRLPGVDRLLGPFEEGLQVAHPEQAGDEPRGLELLQVVDLLPDADEDDGRLDLGNRGQGSPALCGAVQLRDDDAGDADGVVERLRLGPRLLADRRVDHEEPFVRLNRLGDGFDLLDQVRLERMPAGRVHDDHVDGLQGLDPGLRDLRRILRRGVAEERRVDLFRELLQLIVRGGPMDVRRDEADAEPLLLEVLRQLPGRGRLPLAVQANEQDPLLLQRHLAGLPEDLDELLVDDPDDVFPRAHAGGRLLVQRAALQPSRDGKGELDVYVREDEGPLDVADDLFDEGLIDVGGARDLAEGLAERATELLEDHTVSPESGDTLRFACTDGQTMKGTKREGRASLVRRDGMHSNELARISPGIVFVISYLSLCKPSDEPRHAPGGLFSVRQNPDFHIRASLPARLTPTS